jgi:hypothetical protein
MNVKLQLPEDLTRDDFCEAIAEGVRRGFADLTSNLASPCSHFYESIQDGIEQGFASMVATPRRNFYDIVEEGIRKGVAEAVLKRANGQAPIVTRLEGNKVRIDFGQMRITPSMIPDQNAKLYSERIRR